MRRGWGNFSRQEEEEGGDAKESLQSVMNAPNNKFFRRYRELEKYEIEKSPLDPTYEADRMEVLHALSNATKSSILVDTIKPVAAPKYHGKLVRSKEYQAQLRTTRMQNDEKRRSYYQRQAQIRKTENERQMTKELANSLRQYVENHQPIPKKLIEESLAVKQVASSQSSTSPQAVAQSPPSPPKAKPVQPELSITQYRIETTVFPKLDYSLRLQPLAFDRSRTSSKWTSEERARMNALYQELQPPHPKAGKELMHLYLMSFADKFMAFYPSRHREEVIEKIRFLVRNKQLKQVGEERYWQEVAVHSSKG